MVGATEWVGPTVGGADTEGVAVGCLKMSPLSTQMWSWNGGARSENDSPAWSTTVNEISDSWSPPSTISS